MLTAWRTIRQSPSVRQVYIQCRRIADQRPFQAGDIVLLREGRNRSAQPILTRPLAPGRRIDSHRGVLSHEEIIGKRVRDVVHTSAPRSAKGGTEYRLHGVKLEEYVRLSKRLVTPVYPADASLIVELLDLHPDVDHENVVEGPELEILEAGTGHGALTLYMSRAIHAANPPLPPLDNGEYIGSDLGPWKACRRAIIHTIEISERYSQHAQKTVRGFRQGQYYNNIDFHVTDVGAWVRKELANRNHAPFLSHAILDMPNADNQLQDVAAALRTDGTLIVFNPSITQIMQCATKIKHDRIPLDLDRVIELPVNGGAGGREWDVRPVKPRALQKAQAAETESEDDDDSALETDGDSSTEGEGVRDDRPTLAEEASKKDEGWQMVCRPKVGDRIVGGGFLGMWKKKREMHD